MDKITKENKKRKERVFKLAKENFLNLSNINN